MTDRRESLWLRFSAIVLAIVTVAAVVFGAINVQQRLQYDVPDDGVSWIDTPQGVQAFYVASHSPADAAGIHSGDMLRSIHGVPVHRSVEVVKSLWAAGTWSQV